MDYAKTAPNVRDRKLRPSNYDKTTGKTIKPPKGKKTSKSRQYYNPVKVAFLIAIFSKPHKVLVRDTSSQNKTKKKKIHCTPEPFVNSNGMLFCDCCRETLSIHRGGVSKHCGCEKHLKAKAAKVGSTGKAQKILKSIESFKEATRISGVTNMSDKEKRFRYDVLFFFLNSGDPLESIDAHRPMLEKHVTKITESTHLTWLLPIVNILVKSMKNGNITTEIIDTSSRVYGLQPNQIRGMSYDRASPNLTAVQTLRLLFPQSEFFPCISHTITHAGEHFWIPNLTVILHALRGLFSHSKQAKTLWRNLALTVFPSYCDTRW